MSEVASAPKEIVVFSGGTGGAQFAEALKGPIGEGVLGATFAVGTWDSGGDTAGYLPYGVMPPGSIRKPMAALAKNEFAVQLLNYRFEDPEGDSEVHSKKDNVTGNSMIASAEMITGDADKGLRMIAQLLGVPETAQFLHASSRPTKLDLAIPGKKVALGEEAVAKAPINTALDAIQYMDLSERDGGVIPPEHNPALIRSIREAQEIVITPGALASILPYFKIPEIAQAVRESDARKTFIANATKSHNQIPKATVADMIDIYGEVIGADGDIFDAIIANDMKFVGPESKERAIEVGELEGDPRLVLGAFVRDIVAPEVDSMNTIRFNNLHNPDHLQQSLEFLTS